MFFVLFRKIAPSLYAASILSAPIFLSVVPAGSVTHIPTFILGFVGAGYAGCLLRGGFPLITRNVIVLVGVPLVLVGVLSAANSSNVGGKIVGNAFEFGSVGSLVLFAATIPIIYTLSSYSLRRLLFAYVVSMSVAAGALLIFTASFAEKAFLTSEWTILSGALVTALIVCATFVDTIRRSVATRFLFVCMLVLLIGGVLQIFYPPSALAGFIAAITAMLILFVAWKTLGARFPFATGSVALVLLGSALFGVQAPRYLPADVRPSLATTEYVVMKTLFSDPFKMLLGRGPSSFHVLWDRYRPQEFNATPVWNARFDSGYNAILTFTGSFGILGFAALAYAYVVPLARLFRKRKKEGGKSSLMTRPHEAAAPAVFLFFSLTSLFLYPTGTIGFLYGALGVGSLLRIGSGLELTRGQPKRSKSFLVRLSVAMPVLLLSMSLVYVSARQMVAQYAYEHSEYERAHALWPSSERAKNASRALMQEAFSDGLDREESIRKAERALQIVNKAVTPDVYNYSLWATRADIFISLQQLGVAGVGEEARVSLRRARLLAPSRPETAFFEARLEHSLGNTSNAREAVKRSLELKPDYADALLLAKILGP